MTGSRRGFGRERRTRMKLAVSASTAAAFVVAWAGFATNHGSATTTATPGFDAATDARTATPLAGGVRHGVAPASGEPAPIATPAPRARTSRGS